MALSKIPIFGKWVTRIRGIYIHRGDARASLKTINEGVEYLKQGFSLVIFPEGTRSRSSAMAEFKHGSFKLATKARVPIVPVTLNGGYHTYEETGKVTKGMPISTSWFTNRLKPKTCLVLSLQSFRLLLNKLSETGWLF